ncbi:MAG: multi-sensor signal transduction histidine kinase, partial [Actinomycetia bacterium]|nr:multi-sensor signal transduction histidine kinase [Actinomycetes bacterium]
VQKAFTESKMSRYFWGSAELSKPVIVRESSAWPEGSGIKVAIAVPLAMGEGSLGVLCFATKSRDTIQEGEIELLSTIAQYLAISIHRSNTDLQLLDAKEKLLQHADNLEREVALRTARLREIVSELEIFSYSMAHDLRAPIRALIGYCDVLKEDYEKVIPAEPMDIIARLSRACQKLDSLTRDLLQFSKISRTDIELHKVCTDDVVREVLSIYSAEVRERIIIEWPLHDVIAHRGLMHQCIANLIENA